MPMDHGDVLVLILVMVWFRQKKAITWTKSKTDPWRILASLSPELETLQTVTCFMFIWAILYREYF